jgi:hypothetical protein
MCQDSPVVHLGANCRLYPQNPSEGVAQRPIRRAVSRLPAKIFFRTHCIVDSALWTNRKILKVSDGQNKQRGKVENLVTRNSFEIKPWVTAKTRRPIQHDCKPGLFVFFHSTIEGSTRQMYESYQDAMCPVRKFAPAPSQNSTL